MDGTRKIKKDYWQILSKDKIFAIFCYCFYWFDCILLVSLTRKLAKAKLSYYSDNFAYCDIADYLKIVRHILGSVKLKRDRGWKDSKKKSKISFSSSFFLIIRPG